MTASALDPAGLPWVTEQLQTELTQRGRPGGGRRFRGEPVSLKFQGASTQKQSWPWKCGLEVGPETEAWRVAVTATQPWVNVSVRESADLVQATGGRKARGCQGSASWKSQGKRACAVGGWSRHGCGRGTASGEHQWGAWWAPSQKVNHVTSGSLSGN